MRFTPFTKRILDTRRQDRDLTKAGYTKHETEWEILRGWRHREIITDVKISLDGKHVYVKTGLPQE